jgi:hypothetical protein
MASIAHEDEAVPAPASYEETYRSCYARLTRVAYLIIGSNEAAEEVVQDAFVALYPRFQRVRSPEAYLYRSVVNGSRGVVTPQVDRPTGRPRTRGDRGRGARA